MSSDQQESRYLYTCLYYRFLHSLRSVGMTKHDFLVSPISLTPLFCKNYGLIQHKTHRFLCPSSPIHKERKLCATRAGIAVTDDQGRPSVVIDSLIWQHLSLSGILCRNILSRIKPRLDPVAVLCGHIQFLCLLQNKKRNPDCM